MCVFLARCLQVNSTSALKQAKSDENFERKHLKLGTVHVVNTGTDFQYSFWFKANVNLHKNDGYFVIMSVSSDMKFQKFNLICSIVLRCKKTVILKCSFWVCDPMCLCGRVNLRGNRTLDPWHTSPHSKAISQRQLPLAKGFGQCRHSCYRQTQVMCCRLVVGSATYTPPRNGTRPRVLIMVTCTWTKGRFNDLSNVPAPRWAPMW